MVKKSSRVTVGFQVLLVFQITQHSRDVELMKRLVSYFDCGRYVHHNNKDHVDLIVTRFNDITDIIIPFFAKYPIIGIKTLDFAD